MTEGFGEFAHNGGTAETPPAEPERETAAQKRARKRAELAARISERDGETAPKREQGGWAAREPDSGDVRWFTGEVEARMAAVPHGSYEFRKYGDTTEWVGDLEKRPAGTYWARQQGGEWVTFPTALPALRHATPDGAVIRLTNGGVIPR